jgi:hypothetical protein
VRRDRHLRSGINVHADLHQPRLITPVAAGPGCRGM